jgi:predicted metal-dependent HD superfamily phosphohydrolase
MRAAGIDDESSARVAAIVRATKDHVAHSPDAALAVDVDLAILGADPAAFAAFEKGIRREYAWVDDAAYTAGRGAVLRRFVTRPHVFATPVLRALFEARAQENLAHALQRLGAGGGA